MWPTAGMYGQLLFIVNAVRAYVLIIIFITFFDLKKKTSFIIHFFQIAPPHVESLTIQHFILYRTEKNWHLV